MWTLASKKSRWFRRRRTCLTRAQAHLGQLALLGGMILTFGVALAARRRKDPQQAA